MNSVSLVYTFPRLFAARKSLKTFPKSLRGLRKNDYQSALAIRSLIRPYSGFLFNRNCVRFSGASPIWSRFSTMSIRGRNEGSETLEFRLSESSVLKIQKGDITLWSVDGSSDAIVNPANELMLGGGGADGAIHRAAGLELRSACYAVSQVQPGIRCPTGEARITLGFRLPASHVIHTVGPIYDREKNPASSLRNAYRNSLRVANENNIRYIAFTAISCGVYGYPFDEAATIAISTVKEFANNLKEVHFILFNDEIYDVWSRRASELLQK